MVEDAVQQHLDPVLVRRLHHLHEVGLLAQVRIDLRVVARVVTVVRAGPEDRVQVDDGHAEALQVRHLLRDPGEVTAEVVAAVRALGADGLVRPEALLARLERVGVVPAPALRHRAPRHAHDAVERRRRLVARVAVRVRVALVLAPDVLLRVAARRVVLPVRIAEAVGEDLVDDGVLQPVDGLEGRVVDRDRPAPVGRGVERLAPAAVAHVRVVLVVDRLRPVVDDEAVVHRPRRAGIDRRLPEVAAEVGLHVAGDVRGDDVHVHEVLAARVRVVRAQGDARRVVVERAKAQLDAGAGRDRALGLPVDRRAAVVA